MGVRISVDLDGLTFDQLYRFVDHARSAGVGGDDNVTVDRTDELGNDLGAHTFSANLGDVDEPTRPLLIDRVNLDRYVDALSRELSQESDKADLEVLRQLLEDLQNQ